MKSSSKRLLRPLVRPAVVVNRQLIDARFVYVQGLAPTLGSRTFGPLMVLAGRIRRTLRGAYEDDILATYHSLHSIHYGPGGRGYASTPGLSAVETREMYSTQFSRLEYFADTFPDLLSYEDGDAFLDLGCGRGQNLRFLSERFPRSSIKGVDISTDAVEFVGLANSNPRLRVEVGNILDLHQLDSILSERPDHIILSHVFALLLGPSAVATHEMRTELVRHLVSACRKTVIILDEFNSRGNLKVSMEQLNRSVVADDVLGYFSVMEGSRSVLAYSPRSQAVMFQRHSPVAER